jgi:aryl-alcohol dehydrogenase-like predicted oxidoreductase
MENKMNKLVLGTVQFGLDYGINNFNGKPTREKSLAMLDFAYEKGVRIFDTASAYGDAEEILGEFMKSRGLTDKIKVITKLKPNIVEESEGDPYDIILENLTLSLKKLNREYVDGYLFHTPAYIRNKKLVDCFSKLKDQGLVKNIGVSIYEEDDALYATKLDVVDYIQVPYSILDQRLNKTDFFKLAKENNKTVFARSAFLQGLFFMPENKIPEHLSKVKDYFKDLDEIIAKYGLSRQQIALLFSYQNKNIDHVVFGVDTLEQLKEDVEIVEKNIDCEKCIEELKERFISIEKQIIFPSLWKK